VLSSLLAMNSRLTSGEPHMAEEMSVFSHFWQSRFQTAAQICNLSGEPVPSPSGFLLACLPWATALCFSCCGVPSLCREHAFSPGPATSALSALFSNLTQHKKT